jgi:phytoene/squalene synthetase
VIFQVVEAIMRSHFFEKQTLAAAVTRTASRQTDLTIRFLVDKGLTEDAYRAYAYFRWVDDWLDQESRPRQARMEFIQRQKNIYAACCQGVPVENLTPEETMLASMISKETDPNSGLPVYVRNMFAVMSFDADRRERLVSERELDQYACWLATAVTEALHTFIGRGFGSPQGELRYLAVTGAHITHMLRDTFDDIDAGYYNIPHEVLSAHQITPWDVEAPAYRDWVKQRVIKARDCFLAGKKYLAQVECLRCRIAGYAYIHRFEVVLDSIERDEYVLRRDYPERKEAWVGVEMIGQAIWLGLRHHHPVILSAASTTR